MNTSKKLTLSILIPTYNRRKEFERLFERLYSKFSNNPYFEIIVACSSPEYMPTITNKWSMKGVWNVTCLNTKGCTREQNYLKGLSHCRGKYTLIVEDDDIVDTETIYTFVYEHLANNPDADLFVYSLMKVGQSCILPQTKSISSEEFLTAFYERYRNDFQWGQCITNTLLLKRAMYTLWVRDKELDLIQSDELITLMVAQEAKKVCISEYKLLWVGIGLDNYSWNNPKEQEQRNRFRQLLKKYINIMTLQENP